jgi:hypothetical protein
MKSKKTTQTTGQLNIPHRSSSCVRVEGTLTLFCKSSKTCVRIHLCQFCLSDGSKKQRTEEIYFIEMDVAPSSPVVTKLFLSPIKSSLQKILFP